MITKQYQNFSAEPTSTNCPHCKKLSETGTHGGCVDCGRVKHTRDGRRIPYTEPEAS